MRFEVITAVKMSILVFWVVTPCRLYEDTNVSEKHNVSIFRAKINVKEIKYEDADWIQQSQPLINTVMILRVP
jgi:hypothetical protein